MTDDKKSLRWCHYCGTDQDFPDVCLITEGAYELLLERDNKNSASAEVLESNQNYEYYGWYKVTNRTDWIPKSVYRRIRKCRKEEGYPNRCIVLDAYTSKELGLQTPPFRHGEAAAESSEVLLHYRCSVTHSLPRSTKPTQDEKLEKFVRSKGGETRYMITGFPIYGNVDISIRPVERFSLSALIGRTIKHPDYALRVAVYIACVSFALAFAGLVIPLALPSVLA